MAECHGVWVDRLQKLGWGRMFVVRKGVPSPYPNEKWGFDNGAYRDWVRGEPFNEKAYWKSLNKILKVGVPQMAVLPDIVAAGQQSLDFSYSWLDRLPHHFPWYLAVQDGMKATDIDVTPLSGIFLGGTNRYKATAADWVKFAHENQLKFHYGRCGTRNKLAHALHIGADSLDSALPLFSRARFRTFKEDVVNGPQQTDLFWQGEQNDAKK
jgi:hypothetical protein